MDTIAFEAPKFYNHAPTEKQAEFLGPEPREAVFAGMPGAGKSDAILQGALQYVHVPNFTAIIFRQTWHDLKLPDALMDRYLRSSAIYPEVEYRHREATFVFPSGARLIFAAAGDDLTSTLQRYKSMNFQYIGLDEADGFVTEEGYLKAMTRLRSGGVDAPLRVRMACTRATEWMKRRFVREADDSRLLVMARTQDNPTIDSDELWAALEQLDEFTLKRLRSEDW